VGRQRRGSPRYCLSVSAETIPPPPRRIRWSTRRRLSVLLVAVIVVTAAAIGVVVASPGEGPPPLPVAVDPMLPDLAMGPIQDVGVGTTEVGNERLRFAATIVNIGDGPFLLRADRSWPWSDDWVVRQQVEERDGGYTETVTPAKLIYGGDGHNHWHVKFVEAHQLETLSGEIVGRLVKQGFCFFDTDAYALDLPGAPQAAHWGARGCAGNADTRVRMGLSVGWGDKYPWHLIDERIDVTEVPDGEYLIRQIADPSDEFDELDETNNETWLRIELFTRSDGLRDVRTLEAGPPP